MKLEATAKLPKTAIELVNLIGFPAAMELIRALGGRTVTFPKGKRADWQSQREFIVEIVGEADATALAEYFDGVPVYIPRCAKALRAERNRRIISVYDVSIRQASGRAAVAAIAENFGMTERNVYLILNATHE